MPEQIDVRGAKRRAVLFRFDPSNIVSFEHGKRVQYKFSHTKYLLQHLSAFIDRGYAGLAWPHGQPDCLVVEDVTGALKINKKLNGTELSNFFDVVAFCSIYPGDFDVSKPGRVNIWVEPALYWVEHAELFQDSFRLLMDGAAQIIDILVT